MELRQTCVVQAVYIINAYITLERIKLQDGGALKKIKP